MTREEAIKILQGAIKKPNTKDGYLGQAIDMAIQALSAEPCEDMGEVSDGYHTFNQLYHQRAILFATIVNQNPHLSWKSYKHSDGKYCFDSNGEWFIVGIDTPQGSYTYHYAKEYWEYFHCQELECGKEWDGHTEKDVIRLLSLKQEPCDDAVSRQAVLENAKYFMDAFFNEDGKMMYSDHILCEADCKNLMEWIKSFPPVQPIRPKGEWKKTPKAVMGEGYMWFCDKCYREVYQDSSRPYPSENFCPRCGADMRGEEKC